jgi:hypothetical protein
MIVHTATRQLERRTVVRDSGVPLRPDFQRAYSDADRRKWMLLLLDRIAGKALPSYDSQGHATPAQIPRDEPPARSEHPPRDALMGEPSLYDLYDPERRRILTPSRRTP